jgi:hypothetical protein
MLVMILKDQEQRPTRQVVEKTHPSQHEARNDLQTVGRRLFQTNRKILSHLARTFFYKISRYELLIDEIRVLSACKF